MRLVLLTILVAICASANAVEPVTVLGLPLGGKLPTPIQKCKPMPASKYVEQGVCWDYILGTFAGVKNGGLNLPKRDTLPGWVGSSEVSASVRQDGVIQQLTVSGKYADDAPKIIDSISARFGRPSSITPEPPYRWYASWDRSDIGITVICKLSKGCYTRFESGQTHADNMRRIRERVEIDQKRSVSP